MAISTITSAGIATDTLVAGDIAADAVGSSEIAADAVGLSELNDATGVTADYHKVPTFANDAARNTAIPSPANGMIIYNTDASALQQYNGTWSTIAPAPNVTALSGFLNDDTDSTLTIFGTNFTTASLVKMFTAASGGSQIGSNATTTFNSVTKLTAVFGTGSIGVAGSTAYIEVDSAGATNRFATAITVNADPVVALSGNTGTGADATDHLGTYGGVSAGGPADSNTQFLLNFDRGGGIDFEDSSNTGGDGHKVTATADAKIKASPFGDGKSAMFFDGTGDYLTVTGTLTDFDFGTGNFTIEAWVHLTAVPASSDYAMIFGNDASPNLYMGVTDSHLTFSDATSGLQGTTTLVVNTWYHVALVRNSGSTQFYLDGVADGSASTSQDGDWGGSSTVQIGQSPNYAGQYEWTGYLDSFRVVKGTAVYTSDFDVPTTRLTEITNTKLLIHSERTDEGNTAFADSATTGTTHTVTASGGTIHSKLHGGIAPALTYPASGKAFGSSGCFFDGAGDFLTVKDSTDFSFASGSFTFDFWVHMIDTGSTDKISHIWYDGNSSTDMVEMGFVADSSGNCKLFFTAYTSSAYRVNIKTPFSFVEGAWQHVAIVRNTNTWYIFKDGVSLTLTLTHGSYSNALFDAGVDIKIGECGYAAGSRNLNGYLDVFRVSKGIARWTANFTPPTSLYGSVSAALLPTITFTGTTTPALASDEDIEYTEIANTTKAANNQKFSDSGLGLTFTNTADSSLATLTGTLASDAGTTHTNMIVKAQVRKTLGNAAYANASRVVTFSSSTTTAGLAPAMPVSGTGIPASTTITTVDTATTITLSANPTGGTLTGQSLIFEDLGRITHVNGSDTLNNADTMMTIAVAAGGDPVLFNARRYVGTGVARSITGFGFAPDMVWIKCRSLAHSHKVWDSVRGATKYIEPSASTEGATNSQGVTSFDADGVSMGTYNALNQVNATSIAWGWKAGGVPSSSALSIDGDGFGAGTIANDATGVVRATNITQSVNQTGGFSITQFLGHSSGVSWPHNLGGTPDFIIVKAYDVSTYNWYVWHKNLTSTTGYWLLLNADAAETANASGWSPAPTSTVISSGTRNGIGAGVANHMCYAWKAVTGVSAFGTYTGTGGANTITYTGSNSFTAKFIIIRNRGGTETWRIFDGFRNSGAEWQTTLVANEDYVDNTATQMGLTPTSTGFTFDAGSTNTAVNGNTATYIYVAFA